ATARPAAVPACWRRPTSSPAVSPRRRPAPRPLSAALSATGRPTPGRARRPARGAQPRRSRAPRTTTRPAPQPRTRPGGSPATASGRPAGRPPRHAGSAIERYAVLARDPDVLLMLGIGRGERRLPGLRVDQHEE